MNNQPIEQEVISELSPPSSPYSQSVSSDYSASWTAPVPSSQAAPTTGVPAMPPTPPRPNPQMVAQPQSLRPQLPIEQNAVPNLPEAPASYNNGSIFLQVMGVHGGAGATTILAALSAFTNYAVSETAYYPGQTLDQIENSLRVVVARANDYGSAKAYKVIEEHSAFTVVVAVEDGGLAPRVPKVAKSRFNAISVVAPVVYIPFVNDWRFDSTVPPNKKFEKSIHLVTNQLQNLEQYLGRQQ